MGVPTSIPDIYVTMSHICDTTDVYRCIYSNYIELTYAHVIVTFRYRSPFCRVLYI